MFEQLSLSSPLDDDDEEELELLELSDATPVLCSILILSAIFASSGSLAYKKKIFFKKVNFVKMKRELHGGRATISWIVLDDLEQFYAKLQES